MRKKKGRGRKLLEGFDIAVTAWDILLFLPRVVIRIVKNIW